MCRWLAYSGSPILIETLLYKPQHSLIDQSLHSRLGAETTNGDGFGIGWYGVGDTPGVSAAPYQPMPNPSPLVVSAPMVEWRLWSMSECFGLYRSSSRRTGEPE